MSNLYLDSNSIIYDVFRDIPFDGKTTEEYEKEIMMGVCSKIEGYIMTVKPKDTVIVAFDGVAPVAKLEQQRNRRYKSMFERHLMKDIDPEYKQHGWDESAITPGTNFMNTLGSFINMHFTKHRGNTYKKIIISISMNLAKVSTRF